MYYRGMREINPGSRVPQRTCYAESEDGVHWTGPSLGKVSRPRRTIAVRQSNARVLSVAPNLRDDRAVVDAGATSALVGASGVDRRSTSCIDRDSLRLDGFAPVRTRQTSGTMITKPIVSNGDELSLNFATSAAGGVKVEIQDADGKSIRLKFALHDAELYVLRLVSTEGG